MSISIIPALYVCTSLMMMELKYGIVSYVENEMCWLLLWNIWTNYSSLLQSWQVCRLEINSGCVQSNCIAIVFQMGISKVGPCQYPSNVCRDESKIAITVLFPRDRIFCEKLREKFWQKEIVSLNHSQEDPIPGNLEEYFRLCLPISKFYDFWNFLMVFLPHFISPVS